MIMKEKLCQMQTNLNECDHNWTLHKLAEEEKNAQNTSSKSDAEGLKFGSLPPKFDG